jgi:two-component system sensor histidine kinase VicK
LEEKEDKIKNDTDLERTEILYGSDNIVKRTIGDFHKIQERLDNCTDSTGPSVFFNTPIWNEFIELKNRGIKLRFITEITQENINFSKEFLKVTELRHLDGVKGNFGIADGKDYGGSASVKEGEPPIELIRSNVKTFVDQQQFFFEMLWNKSIRAEQKIKEIEDGKPFGIWTRIIDDKDEILKEIFLLNTTAENLSICTTIGGLKMSHNNLRDSFRNLIKKNPNGNNKGLRFLLTINKDSIYLVKIFIDLGAIIKHIRSLPPMSFGVSDKGVAITIEKMEGGKQSQKFLFSNEPLYVDHFNNLFEELWNKGLDANRRINDIEDGLELEDVEIIQNPKQSIKQAWSMTKSAKEEILLLFSSSNGLRRQIKMGVMDLLPEISDVHKINIKILIPFDKDVYHMLEELQSEFPYVDIRSTDEKLRTRITMLVVDRKESMVWEIKDDDTEGSSYDAVGIAAYTNIKAISLSYASIFDNLWTQTDMYEKLKSHDKMQQEFLDIAAHELRTPIQPIIGIIDILRSESKKNNNNNNSTTRQSELLDVAQRNAKRLIHLIEEILDVTRIEGNTLKINRESISLNEIISNVTHDFAVGLEKNRNKKNIFLSEYHIDKSWEKEEKEENINKKPHQNTVTIEEKISQNPNIFVNADKGKLIQVIYNLLDNASKFTKNGKISLTVNMVYNHSKNSNSSCYNKQVIVSVQDTGTGISPEIMPRLFTKFASKSFQGTGLGLYISKNIIEAHGGRIWAENNKDGRGATFSFRLPLDE